VSARRALRLTIPAEIYASIEFYAKAMDVPIATAARLAMAFGVTAIEALTATQLAEEDE
jgi:hypothetical protein